MGEGIFSTSGRMTRRYFWGIFFAVSVFRYLINSTIVTYDNHTIISITNLLVTIFMFFQFIKRVHDTNRSGWFALVPIYNIILCLLPGTKGENDYGEDPRE